MIANKKTSFSEVGVLMIDTESDFKGQICQFLTTSYNNIHIQFKFLVFKGDGEIYSSGWFSQMVYLMLQQSADEWDSGRKSKEKIVMWI